MSDMIDLWTREGEGYSICVVDAYQGDPEDDTDNDWPPLVLINLSHSANDFDISRLDAFLADLRAAREVLVKALEESKEA